jgi:ubiquinone/menaquinone biosynthesis C-methylase UbiE
MLGVIIKVLALPPKASILEFGPGWGNTTLALAQMGYDVTAIDIEQRYLDLIARRCEGLSNAPHLIQGDFGKVHELEKRFDAILFYESFHHCSDHNALLPALSSRLTPSGRILFAAEPINEAFPMPWGLRLDGMSLWSIRRFGWLELGFSETYFREALRRAGFTVEKQHYPVTGLGVVFVARPASR